MPRRKKKLPQPEKMLLSEYLDKLGFIILVGLMEQKEEKAKRLRIVKNSSPSQKIAANVCTYLSKHFPNCEINREELFEKTFDILNGCDIIWP